MPPPCGAAPLHRRGPATTRREHRGRSASVRPPGYSGGRGTAKQIADSVREGEDVLVIHGVDYNGNGVYDFEGAGASELDPNLPAEGW